MWGDAICVYVGGLGIVGEEGFKSTVFIIIITIPLMEN